MSRFLKGLLISNLFFAQAEARVQLLDPAPISGTATAALPFAARTAYHQLEAKYESARQEPTQTDFKSWRSGRCFFTDRPMQPVAAMVASDSDRSGGPLFNDSTYLKIVTLVERTQPATYFDRVDAKTRAAIQSAIVGYRTDIAYAIRTNASLRVDVPRSLSKEARHYAFRRDDKYLYLELACSDAGGCRTQKQYVAYREDETAAYCYFFRNVGAK
jgi:hypothetical protein